MTNRKLPPNWDKNVQKHAPLLSFFSPLFSVPTSTESTLTKRKQGAFQQSKCYSIRFNDFYQQKHSYRGGLKLKHQQTLSSALNPPPDCFFQREESSDNMTSSCHIDLKWTRHLLLSRLIVGLLWGSVGVRSQPVLYNTWQKRIR